MVAFLGLADFLPAPRKRLLNFPILAYNVRHQGPAASVLFYFVHFPPDVHHAVALCRLARRARAGVVAYYLGHLAESAFSF